MKNLFPGENILNMVSKNQLDYIFIPMAGHGRRYKKKNFSTIKPFILIDNETIFEKSIKSLPNSFSKIAVLKKNIYHKNLIINKIFKREKIRTYLLNKNTEGQSDTIYKLKNSINLKKNGLIHSCDYIMKYSHKNFIKCLDSDVVIFVYKLKSRIVKNYNKFAYCKIDKKTKKVLKIVEKKTISDRPWNDLMVIGTFWFRSMENFIISHELALKKKQRVNGEFYIANNINNLINLKYKITFFEVDQWINLGDFFDLNQYIYYKNFFLKNSELIKC